MNYKTKLNIKNYIGQSRVGGRGVFAGKNYKYGEIIEIAYCIKDDPNNYSKAILRDYLFRIDNNNSLICLGYGSFYSHNDYALKHHEYALVWIVYKSLLDQHIRLYLDTI